MKNKIGIMVKLVKIGESDHANVLIDQHPVGYVIEGILLAEIEENKPIRIVHLKNETNRQYGAFCSTNIQKIDLRINAPWTLTTKNSVYTIEEIDKPELDAAFNE